MSIDLDRLSWLWDNEEPDDDWRESLSPEEAAIVAQWDDQYDAGILSMCEDILAMDARNGK